MCWYKNKTFAQCFLQRKPLNFNGRLWNLGKCEQSLWNSTWHMPEAHFFSFVLIFISLLSWKDSWYIKEICLFLCRLKGPNSCALCSLGVCDAAAVHMTLGSSFVLCVDNRGLFYSRAQRVLSLCVIFLSPCRLCKLELHENVSSVSRSVYVVPDEVAPSLYKTLCAAFSFLVP